MIALFICSLADCQTAAGGGKSTAITQTAPAGLANRQQSNAPGMVLIPAGAFLMGSAASDPDAQKDEQPRCARWFLEPRPGGAALCESLSRLRRQHMF